ncbi:MAG: hypothetical protein AAF126_23345 [Chloroflexota bacterium]
MMSLKRRLDKLEQNIKSDTTVWRIAEQDADDSNVFHLWSYEQQTEPLTMTEDELTAWQVEQGDNVMLIRLVYQDVLGEGEQTMNPFGYQ